MRDRIIEYLTPYIGSLWAKLITPFYLEFLLLGAILGSWIVFRRLQKERVNLEPYLLASAVGYFGVLLGGRLAWMIFNFKEYIEDPTKVWRIWEGGFSVFGAFGLGALVVYLVLRYRQLPFLPFADAMAPAAALVLGMTRLGCFLNGCCFGKPTKLPWGVSYAAGSPPWKAQYLAGFEIGDSPLSLPTHPVQLYEAALGILLFVILWRGWRQRQFDGQLCWAFVTVYGVTRFLLEFLRADPREYVFGNLSTVHFVAVTMAGIGTWQYFLMKRRNAFTGLKLALYLP